MLENENLTRLMGKMMMDTLPLVTCLYLKCFRHKSNFKYNFTKFTGFNSGGGDGLVNLATAFTARFCQWLSGAWSSGLNELAAA